MIRMGAWRVQCLKDNKCSIYDKRPLICRLYGVVENMKCRFGCKPTRYLTNKEGVALVSAVKKLEVDNIFRTIKSQWTDTVNKQTEWREILEPNPPIRKVPKTLGKSMA